MLASHQSLLKSMIATESEIITAIDTPLLTFGAFAGGTILTYLFKLENKTCYVLDDNPLRHGLYSPNNAAQVISPDKLSTLPTSNLVVLPWRFASSIKARHHKDFLHNCKSVHYVFDGI